jgi:hypothetical protein
MSYWSYWNSNGTYQAQYEELIKLVPHEGEIKKGMCKHVFSLERFRKACNCYYDVFNNGGGNRDASTAKFFPGVLKELRRARKYFGGKFDWDYIHSVCDKKMDGIIREAYIKNIGDITIEEETNE